MEVAYSKESDALYIRLSEKKVVESTEVAKGFVIDIDENGVSRWH